jgi:ribosomal subunit interface protein
LSAFDKLVSPGDESIKCNVEVGKTTRHHKSGDIFRAEINLHTAGKDFYAVSEKGDLYAAIDEVKDEISRALVHHKGKSTTLMRKGAATVKNILRGFGNFRRKK